jgi:hypothetical protein
MTIITGGEFIMAWDETARRHDLDEIIKSE